MEIDMEMKKKKMMMMMSSFSLIIIPLCTGRVQLFSTSMAIISTKKQQLNDYRVENRVSL